MLRHCSLLTIEDVQKDEASIIEVLTAIHEQRLPNDISLLNYYRELPVSFPAYIESVDRGVVQLKVHEMQVASMLMQKATIIKSGHLRFSVIANVLRLRRRECTAYLAQFSYVRVHADQRAYVRVKVAGKYSATFHYGKHQLKGLIEDLSFSGVAIKAPSGCILEENPQGTVSLWLPGATLEVPGRLLKVQADDLFIFALEVDDKSEKVLSQFIFQQQSHIIRELKEIGS